MAIHCHRILVDLREHMRGSPMERKCYSGPRKEVLFPRIYWESSPPGASYSTYSEICPVFGIVYDDNNCALFLQSN
jgi:hypothetical protein